MMFKTYSYIAFLLLLSCMGSASAQSKGDKYYEKGEFIKAIPIYKKETRSKSETVKQHAHIQLGHSYRAINNYSLAEESYRNAVESGSELPPEVHYNYAQILQINNKYEEAAEQYEKYLKYSPNDKHAANAKKFCLEIKYYLSKPMEYKVKNAGVVNTSKSEFSPYVVKDKVMFIAEREAFNFVNYEVNEANGEPFLNMYVSAINGQELKKEKPFSKSINTAYHDGPGCVSADGTTLYFTRTSQAKTKSGVNQSKIYTATGSEKSWKKIKPLEISSDDYSLAHPSISADNAMLFFTSNMPGGFGGKDLYMSKREGDSWSKPVNLGPDINTTGDEMFPSIRKDGVLFFSSNGLPGFGGLDIYSAKLNVDQWILQRNEGMDLNSSTDDFGITFLNDTMGYFSSNRAGGKGSDDIYIYTYRSKSMAMSGNVLLTENINDKAKNKKVVLLDENGKAIDSTRTDANGYFEFKNLDADKKYMTSIEEEDPLLVNKARFYLAEKDSTIHRVSGKYKGNRFVFKNLPVDPNELPDLYTDDELIFAGTLMHSDKQALKNVKLKIVNEFGDVVEETTTNEYGAFAFRNIPADQNYIVSIDDSNVDLPEGTKITLNNKVGKEVRSFYKTKTNFVFKVLSSDKAMLDEMDAEDANLVMGIYGYMYDQDKRPLVNIKLRVKNEDGSNPQEWTTTEGGKFNFQNLDAEKQYIFEADENNPNLQGVKRIYIADSKGRIYKVVDLTGNKFSFRLLDVDKHTLGEFVVDDPWLKVADLKKEPVKPAKPAKPEKEVKEKKEVVKKEKVKEEEAPAEEESELSITIVENIYYPYGEWVIDANGLAVLDKAVDALIDYPKLVMEISSHTDSQSSADFNLGLSKKRAQTAVDYLISKGIDRSRLKATGYGETRLLNKCADGVECTDDEHKVNRRTEFKITKPIKR